MTSVQTKSLGSTGSFNRVAVFDVSNINTLDIEGIPSVNLADIRITESLTSGGRHRTILSGTDFATATEKMPVCLPDGSIATTIAGSFFRITLNVLGASEIAIDIKPASNSGTIDLTASGK